MASVGLISVLRVLRRMKAPKVTAMKWVTRPLFKCGSGKFLGNNGI